MLLLLACIFTSAAGAAERTAGMVHLKELPPVDGSLKGLSTLAPFAEWDEPQEVVWGASEWEGTEDFSGTVYLGWNEEFLFVSAIITDDVIVGGNLTGDGLEIFLDVPRQPGEAKDKTRILQIGTSIGADANGKNAEAQVVLRGDRPGPVAGAKIAAKRLDTGYQITVALPWETLGIMGVSEGVQLGIDVVGHDSDYESEEDDTWVKGGETLVSLLNTPWAEGNANRMLEVRLGDDEGGLNVETMGFGYKVVKKSVRVGPGQTMSVKITGDGSAKESENEGGIEELVIQARIDSSQIGKGTGVLKIELNGVILDLDRVRNRTETFRMGQKIETSYRGPGWFLMYSPDFKPAPVTSPFAIRGVDPYELDFDVIDLWKQNGENVIKLSHSDPRVARAIIANIGLGKHLVPKKVARLPMQAPTGRIPYREPSVESEVGFLYQLSEGGGIRVELGGRTWMVESMFSTTEPGWASLMESGDGGWDEIEASGDTLTAKSKNFGLKRTLQRDGDRLIVKDRLENIAAMDLPVMVRHKVDLGDGVTGVYLSGLPVESPILKTEEGGHPSSLGLYLDKGIGLISEDDLMRTQAWNYRNRSEIGIDNRRLVIAKGQSVTLEYSIYPLESPDPFLFANRIRKHWGVNFTIDGSFCFLSASAPIAEKSDLELGTYLTGKSAKYVAINPGAFKNRIAYGTTFTGADISGQIDLIERIKLSRDDSEGLYSYSCFVSAGDGDAQTFAKDAHITYDGKPGYFGNPIYPVFLPREGSDFAKKQDELIAARWKKMPIQGIYWDDLNFIATQRFDYSAQWGGQAALISTKTHQIETKISDADLVTLSWRLKTAKDLLSKGVLIARGAPRTRSFTQLHFPRVVRTTSISNLAKMQLYTPIGFGDQLTERTAEDCYRNMLEALDYGALYYWFNYRVKPNAPTLTSSMFPITYIEMGRGFIIGEERILANRSGYYGWGDMSEFETLVFDEEGRQTLEVEVQRIIKRQKAYAEVRIPEGYSVAIIRTK
ncbi:MAG: sugar-binding protein [Verrucomicrobiota bacterium]